MPTLWEKQNSITAKNCLAHSVICFTPCFVITFFFYQFVILGKCQVITLSDMEDARHWSTFFFYIWAICVLSSAPFLYVG
uniref:Uncharacterized protein n=1 Tax=Ixodes ricinus TaxID=34613 RepID=A0A6B0U7B3_IXORI